MEPPPSQGCDDVECQYTTPEGIPTWEILYTPLPTILVQHTQPLLLASLVHKPRFKPSHVLRKFQDPKLNQE